MIARAWTEAWPLLPVLLLQALLAWKIAASILAACVVPALVSTCSAMLLYAAGEVVSTHVLEQRQAQGGMGVRKLETRPAVTGLGVSAHSRESKPTPQAIERG